MPRGRVQEVSRYMSGAVVRNERIPVVAGGEDRRGGDEEDYLSTTYSTHRTNT